jgi:hypothetical protein
MPSLGFVVPVLPGKEQTDLDWMGEMTGPRRQEYESSWKQLGVTRHAVCISKRLTARSRLCTWKSTTSRALWKRSRRRTTRSTSGPRAVQDVHGIDLQSGPPPQSQQIHDHNF